MNGRVIPLCAGCRVSAWAEAHNYTVVPAPVHDHFCDCQANTEETGKHYPGWKHMHTGDKPWRYPHGKP